jgi:hypothetical protein
LATVCTGMRRDCAASFSFTRRCDTRVECRCASNCTAEHRVPVYFTRFVRGTLGYTARDVLAAYRPESLPDVKTVLVCPTVGAFPHVCRCLKMGSHNQFWGHAGSLGFLANSPNFCAKVSSCTLVMGCLFPCDCLCFVCDSLWRWQNQDVSALLSSYMDAASASFIPTSLSLRVTST